MRKFLLSVVALVFTLSAASPLWAQGAPPQGGADQPYTVEYYYKVQWGHQQEFLDLFLKNHYPLLKTDCGDGADALREDRRAGVSHHGRRAVGLSRDDPFQEFDGGDDVESGRRGDSSRNCGRIRRSTRRKSSDGLRFLPGIGICR